VLEAEVAVRRAEVDSGRRRSAGPTKVGRYDQHDAPNGPPEGGRYVALHTVRLKSDATLPCTRSD